MLLLLTKEFSWYLEIKRMVKEGWGSSGKQLSDPDLEILYYGYGANNLGCIQYHSTQILLDIVKKKFKKEEPRQ